jgi:hypothetical protein
LPPAHFSQRLTGTDMQGITVLLRTIITACTTTTIIIAAASGAAAGAISCRVSWAESSAVA